MNVAGETARRNPPDRPQRLLDFRSGGWVLLLAGVLTLGVVAWRLAVILPTLGHRHLGDGRNIDTFGFDLSNLRVSRDVLVGGGILPDSLHALNEPAFVSAAELKDGEKLGGVRKLTSSDRVIAVTVAGQARAYPLWILNWHEIVNDTLGGEPIAVTYSPLCDAAVVFERRVDHETLEFGVSGMLLNSNLVMFDRRGDRARESLWSQLQMRAIAGPAAAAGRTLRVRPVALMPWSAWRAANPTGSVLLPEPQKLRNYKLDPYNTYFNSDEVRFPVQPLPPADGWARKAPVIAVRAGGGAWTTVKMREILERADASGAYELRLGERPVRFQVGGKPPLAWFDLAAPAPAGAPEIEVVQACWFAWYAAAHAAAPDASLP